MFARRPMVWFAFACVLGTALGSVAGGAEWTWWLTAAGMILLGVSLLRGCRATTEPSPEQCPLLPRDGLIMRAGRERVLLAAGLLLAAAACWRADNVWQRHMVAGDGLPRTFPATLILRTPPEASIISDRPCFWRCTADLVKADGQSCEPVTVQLSGYGDPDLKRGDTVRGFALKQTITPPAFPGDFNLRQYLASRGASLSLRLMRNPEADETKRQASAYTVVRSDTVTPLGLLDTLRARGIRTVLSSAPPEEGRFLAVVLFGYRVPGADEESDRFHDLRTSFRNVGIGHLLAISGLHVGLVVGLAWTLVSCATADRRARALVCIAVCLLYLALSGGRIAATRASIMAVVYLTGFVVARRGDFMSSLGLAACAILLVNPPALLDVGFQLSFVTVLFISRLCVELDPLLEGGPLAKPGEPPRGRVRRLMDRFGRGARGLAALSIAAWLGVWPLAATAFYQIHPVGLIANILVLPLMSLVLAGGVLAPWLGPLSMVAVMPTRLLIVLARWMEALPASSLAVARPEPWRVALYYAAFALLFLRRTQPEGARRRGWTAASLLAVLLTGSLLVRDMAGVRRPENTCITMLNDGRGETAVVETADGDVVAVGRVAHGGRTLGRYLRARGMVSIDKVLAFRSNPDTPPPSHLTDLLQVRGWRVIPWRTENAEDWSWQKLEGTDEIELTLSRDSDGGLIWWAVRAGTVSAAMSEWCWPEQLRYRLERRVPGTYAPLTVLRVRGAEAERELASLSRARWVLVGHEGAPETGKNVLWRDSVGAVRIEETGKGRPCVSVYTGSAWREIPERARRPLVSDGGKR